MLITKSFDAFTKAVKSLHGELSATPERIVKEMFSNLDTINWKNPDLKILDPAAGFGTFLREAYIRLKEFHSEEHILNNMLYACEINGFKTLFLEKKMGLRNIYKGDFLTMKLPEGWPKEFDIVVSNPPYGDKTNTNLHMQFLSKSIEISKDKILFVQPGSHFLSPRDLLKNTNISSRILSKIEFFNGNKIFNISKYFYLCITYFEKNKSTDEFEFLYRDLNESGESSSFNDLTHLGSEKKILDLREKYKNISKGNDFSKDLKRRKRDKFGKLKDVPTKDFLVPITGTRGNVNSEGYIFKNDFFTFLSKDTKVMKKSDINEGEIPYHWIEFDTEEEAVNFIEYAKTYFFRCGFSFYKFNNAVGGTLELVPKLDFKKKWTDDNLYKHFSITKEDQAHIKEIIPSYYD